MASQQLLVERYLEYVRVEKRLATRTVELYALDLSRLAEYAAQVPVELTAVRNAHIRRWVAQMHSGGRSGRGIALILSGWRGFYTWLGRQHLVASNPVQDVRSPKAPKPLPKALGVDDAVQLADYKNDSAARNVGEGYPAESSKVTVPDGETTLLELRDRAIVELLYSSGLRVGELIGLDALVSADGSAHGRGWIDVQDAQAHVCGKGRKWRAVPVGGQALAALQAWLQVRADWLAVHTAADGTLEVTPALFIGRNGTRLTAQSVWQRLRSRSLQAGLATPVHPHMLRHSFASHVLQSSGDLRAVQELLGHENISTTQVYTRLDFQHLAKAYDAAHPRAHFKGPKKD
ncbi:MAG: tyrosine-type recombinase/integrase [Burkholderiales bacterium]|nr:tyrosine-type recombinase/integrase [Burkholderiales bacterium]